MITKCRFCEYHKETELSKPIIKVLFDTELPHEDWILWMQRLVQTHGTKDWNGVKIHMGRMHKDQTYYGIWPETELSNKEHQLITWMTSSVASESVEITHSPKS
jgi:hypothetical protein